MVLSYNFHENNFQNYALLCFTLDYFSWALIFRMVSPQTSYRLDIHVFVMRFWIYGDLIRYFLNSMQTWVILSKLEIPIHFFVQINIVVNSRKWQDTSKSSRSPRLQNCIVHSQTRIKNSKQIKCLILI